MKPIKDMSADEFFKTLSFNAMAHFMNKMSGEDAVNIADCFRDKTLKLELNIVTPTKVYKEDLEEYLTHISTLFDQSVKQAVENKLSGDKVVELYDELEAKLKDVFNEAMGKMWEFSHKIKT